MTFRERAASGVRATTLGGTDGDDGKQGRRMGAPRKRAQLINGLTAYLRTAEGDGMMSLELVKIARRIGVSDDTIRNYRDDPEVDALLQWLDRLRGQRAEERQRRTAAYAAEQAENGATSNGGPVEAAVVSGGAERTRSGMDGLRASLRADAAAALTYDGLRRQIVQTMREIEAVMLGYTGQCRRERDERNVRRVAYDLDVALIRLHKLQAALAPLAAEYRRRDKSRCAEGTDDTSALAE